MEEFTLTQIEQKIERGLAAKMIIQNQSDAVVLWATEAGGTNYFKYAPGESWVVDYDIWAKTDSYGTNKIMIGRIS